MNTLSNDIISISIDDHGAELTSIKAHGREYLWNADPEFWKRHSPVLFPIVGSVWQGEYRSHGNTYKMGQHGFARDMEHTLVSKSGDEIMYELRSTDETLQKYPYPFILNVGYRLHDNIIDVIWKVTNPSDDNMYFSIGAHPAFYWPELDQEHPEGYLSTESRGFFRFTPRRESLISSVIGEGGCIVKGFDRELPLSDGVLPLYTETFNHDALVLENSQVDSVTLCDGSQKPYLTLRFDAPLVGLWSPPHKNAPFVCIEPWYGRADQTNYTGTYEEKEWMQHLAPHATFSSVYQIIIH